MIWLSQRDIDEAWRGFRLRLQRRGFSRAFIERQGEDLFGQALLEISKAIAGQTNIYNAVGWLINCSWRRTQNLLDQESRRPCSVSVEEIELLASDGSTPEEEALKLRDDGSDLPGIRFLPPVERKLIKLIYIDEMSCREAGRAVGLGKSAADRHHNAALARLRHFFTP